MSLGTLRRAKNVQTKDLRANFSFHWGYGGRGPAGRSGRTCSVCTESENAPSGVPAVSPHLCGIWGTLLFAKMKKPPLRWLLLLILYFQYSELGGVKRQVFAGFLLLFRFGMIARTCRSAG
jgi:hypothetical protein